MRNRFVSSTLTVVAVFAVSTMIHLASVNAQGSRQPTTGGTQAAAKTPDFSGVWLQSEEQSGGLFIDEPYPMQPWVEELFKYHQDPNGTTRNEMDPNISKCFPRGPTSNWLGGNRPFEI